MPSLKPRSRKPKIDFLKASQNAARFRELGKPINIEKGKRSGN